MNHRNVFDLESHLLMSIEALLKAGKGEKVKEYLKQVKSREISFLNCYQKRKSEGVYYTDEEISDFMVKESIILHLNNILSNGFRHGELIRNLDDIYNLDSNLKKKLCDSLLNLTICDPACGAGVFLLSSAKYLYLILNNINSKLSESDLKKSIVRNLYGFDINKKAIEICVLKLFSWASVADNLDFKLFNDLKSNIILKNSILASFKISFDIIIGNPPYGNILLSKEKEILKRKGIFYKDIYCSFLLKSIEWSDGTFCFLIPKSFLLRQGYIHLREKIFRNVNLRKIFDIGPNLFKKATNEVLIMIYDKKNGNKEKLEVYDYPEMKIIEYDEQNFDNLRICFNNQCPMYLKSKKNYAYSLKFKCEYCSHETIKHNRIRIKPTLKKLKILQKIEKEANLNYLNIVDFPKMIRGEEDRGLKEVRKLVLNNLDGNCVFVNAKDDFSKYFIKKTKSLDIDEIDPTLLKGDNYEYYKGPRLLIKHNKIIPEAYFTEENMCFTSSIYSLLHNDMEELKYLCAVLNSNLMNFYCTYGINNQKDTTINLNQYMIRHLPIVKPDAHIKKQIVDRAEKIIFLLKQNDGKYDLKTKKILEKIDCLIYNLYSISEREIEIIN